MVKLLHISCGTTTAPHITNINMSSFIDMLDCGRPVKTVEKTDG
jgi:hypothetical protein